MTACDGVSAEVEVPLGERVGKRDERHGADDDQDLDRRRRVRRVRRRDDPRDRCRRDLAGHDEGDAIDEDAHQGQSGGDERPGRRATGRDDHEEQRDGQPEDDAEPPERHGELPGDEGLGRDHEVGGVTLEADDQLPARRGSPTTTRPRPSRSADAGDREVRRPLRALQAEALDGVEDDARAAAVPDRKAEATMRIGVNGPCQNGRAPRTPKTAPSVAGATIAMQDEATQAAWWIRGWPKNMLQTSTRRKHR